MLDFGPFLGGFYWRLSIDDFFLPAQNFEKWGGFENDSHLHEKIVLAQTKIIAYQLDVAESNARGFRG